MAPEIQAWKNVGPSFLCCSDLSKFDRLHLKKISGSGRGLRTRDHWTPHAPDRPELGRRPGAQREVQHRQVLGHHRAEAEHPVPDFSGEAVRQQTLRRLRFRRQIFRVRGFRRYLIHSGLLQEVGLLRILCLTILRLFAIYYLKSLVCVHVCMFAIGYGRRGRGDVSYGRPGHLSWDIWAFYIFFSYKQCLRLICYSAHLY